MYVLLIHYNISCLVCVKEFMVEKALRVSRLPLEPDPSDPDAMQVLLRLPSGHRLERWFRSTDKLQVPYRGLIHRSGSNSTSTQG